MVRITNKTRTNATTIVPRQMFTKKGTTKRKVMLTIDGTSRIPVVPPSWKSAHYAWCKRCRR